MPSSPSIPSSLTNFIEDPQRQLQQYAHFSHAAITALLTRARNLLSSSPLLRGLISTDLSNTAARRTLMTGLLSASLFITMVSLLYWLNGGSNGKSKSNSKSNNKNKSKSKSDGSSITSSKKKSKKKKNSKSKSKSGSNKHSDDVVELSVEEKVKNQIDAVLNDVNVNIVPEVDNYEAALIDYHKNNTTAAPTPISASTVAHPTANANATPIVNVQDNQQQQQRVDQKTKDNLNYKYLYLEETLLKQLMNLDGVDHQGIEHLRQDRKAAIKYVQGLHKKIDQLKKEYYN